MAKAAESTEPSMEEILASIRRIISDDDEPGAGAEASKADGGAAAADPSEDAVDDGVLELTDDMVSDAEDTPPQVVGPDDADLGFGESEPAAAPEPAPEKVPA